MNMVYLKSKQIINIILIICIISCSQKNDNNTIIFDTYLSETFNRKIPKDFHIFIVIPSFGCKGCVKNNLSVLLNHLKEFNLSAITLVTTSANDYQKANNKMEVLFDKKMKLSEYNLPLGSFNFIITKENRVLDIDNFDLKPLSLSKLKKIITY